MTAPVPKEMETDPEGAAVASVSRGRTRAASPDRWSGWLETRRCCEPVRHGRAVPRR